MSDIDDGRDPSGQALAVPVEPASGLAPLGFDPSREEPLRCTFCAKTQHEVERLIAGPAVFICNECVDLCGDIVREERKPQGKQRGVPCPGCGERISMIAAVGRDQRWGIDIRPGPTGLLQAKTVAGAIDGAQRMMRASCREDGANVQTYVESMRMEDDGRVTINFVTLATSKKWRDSDGSGAAGETQGGSTEGDSAGPQDIAP